MLTIGAQAMRSVASESQAIGEFCNEPAPQAAWTRWRVFVGPRMKHRNLIATMAVVLGGSIGFVCWAKRSALPESLFQPALEQKFTLEQRWARDFDLANEASMRIHASRRFDTPDRSFLELRAAWFDELARTDETADLLRQLFDFRSGFPINNEAAFTRLYERGQQGDVGSRCMAWLFYRHFMAEDTATWKLGYEQVTREALKEKDSGHPVCAGIDGYLHLDGALGYEKNHARALSIIESRATHGLYATYIFLADANLTNKSPPDPARLRRYMCWTYQASLQSPRARFDQECRNIQEDRVFNGSNGERVSISTELKVRAAQWCMPDYFRFPADCVSDAQ